METPLTLQIQEELKPIIALLNQMKAELDTVKTEVHEIHAQVTNLPTGKQFAETR